jgi:hypothetical protein
MARSFILAAAAALALCVITVTRADGEAGLVVDDGETVRTYCVAFEGEGISGEELLRRAGLSFDQFGGGARVVCSIDGLGCSDASSFDGCFCQCRSGAGSCTYWAFFIQRYGGAWQYSTLGFNLAQARNGDLHGWKWGRGGGQSAPPPAPASFEEVCGHAPRRTDAEAATPASPAPASMTPTQGPGSTTGPRSATATGSVAPPATATATRTPAGPSATATGTAATAAPPTVTVTLPPASGGGGEGGAGARAWAGFGALAAILVAAIGAGLAWRRKRGG